MSLLKKINEIERIDSLIRRKGTGSAKELADKMGVSESYIFRLLNLMKMMGAPIIYCESKRSYCYEYEVEFAIGFVEKKDGLDKIKGGMKKNNNFFLSLSNFDSEPLYLWN